MLETAMKKSDGQKERGHSLSSERTIVPLPSSLKNPDVDDLLPVRETTSDRQRKLPIAVRFLQNDSPSDKDLRRNDRGSAIL